MAITRRRECHSVCNTTAYQLNLINNKNYQKSADSLASVREYVGTKQQIVKYTTDYTRKYVTATLRSAASPSLSRVELGAINLLHGT